MMNKSQNSHEKDAKDTSKSHPMVRPDDGHRAEVQSKSASHDSSHSGSHAKAGSSTHKSPTHK